MGRAIPPRAAAAIAGDEDDDKSSWPEVVGWVMLNAADKINSDRPDVSVAFYMLPTPLPTDYDANRVIIVGDERSVVVRTPVIG
ncbi:hypothetical protein PR202_ga06320 [Eleusine coracana subsp. coracana]|uniref:Uncharacterized protein n=1 Tax=Eleusine coracana subsp. coracana TaxID=191504 RepID=A0AAV5BUQ8_ELECO|nr:hypothetical protein QOZ80_2AG0099940 [Eleusine coracana subsp. coracana]GJM90075.1 hypothetical protein PR202_ga06320 [Eleusine coracana subsp. coracana]